MTISKNTIKYLRSLRQKKFRQKYNNFVVEGDKMAKEILCYPETEVEGIYALESWITTHKSELLSFKDRVFNISVTELGQISNLNTPNQVFIVLKQPSAVPNYKYLAQDLTLYLDDIQDPGNMGTILRIADWFGIPHIFCSPNCVEIYNPKVIQATMGAFLRVRTSVITLAALKQEMTSTFYGATMNGNNLFSTTLSKTAVIVIGNEGQGIDPENLALVDQCISIPSARESGMESLNAGVATGIICAAFRNKE